MINLTFEPPTEDMTLNQWRDRVHNTALVHGWWEPQPITVFDTQGVEFQMVAESSVGEKMMLMVTELAEAFEEHRNGHAVDEVYYEYTRLPGNVKHTPRFMSEGIWYVWVGTSAYIDEDTMEPLSENSEFDKLTPGNAKVHGYDAKPEGVPIELVDTIIRIMDLAGRCDIDLEKAMAIKAAYNDTRPYRHGGKRA